MPAGKNSAIIKPETPMVRDQTAFKLGALCSSAFCVLIDSFMALELSRIYLFQMLREKRREFLPSDHIHPVVEVHVPSIRKHTYIIGFCGLFEGVFKNDTL